jgi:hypothetical protein
LWRRAGDRGKGRSKRNWRGEGDVEEGEMENGEEERGEEERGKKGEEEYL